MPRHPASDKHMVDQHVVVGISPDGELKQAASGYTRMSRSEPHIFPRMMPDFRRMYSQLAVVPYWCCLRTD